MAIAASLGAVAIVAYLWAYDPAQHLAPRCPFKALTGLDCPGCGSQRALHALLHGRFSEAWHYNAALLPALLLAALYGLNPRRLRPVLHSTAAPFVVAALIVAWWIGRNLWLTN